MKNAEETIDFIRYMLEELKIHTETNEKDMKQFVETSNWYYVKQFIASIERNDIERATAETILRFIEDDKNSNTRSCIIMEYEESKKDNK